jgi:hypothetical protein
MTLADDVLRGIAKRHPELSDPERRLEIAQALGHDYVSGRPDAETRVAIRKAAEALMRCAPDVPQETRSENIGEIYVLNILWFTRGAVFASETHHVSYADKQDGRDIEEFLVLESENDFRLVEGSSWACVANNVPFEVLDDTATVRFLGRERDRIVELGRFNVADMRRKVRLEQ